MMKDPQEPVQLELFADEFTPPNSDGMDGARAKVRCTHTGGSQNPIVFNDYESFIAKFTDRPKTTDECWTPQDVYEAVVRYVGTVTDLTGKVICRPFYPGGDYETAEYPDNGVVIDNPPFSSFTKICKFYSEGGVPFFLFGPGLTIMACCKYCTAVIVPEQIKFSNGALVKCNFASNLYGDAIVTTAPLLGDMLKDCPSQQAPLKLPKYKYPDEVLSVSQLQSLARGGEPFTVRRSESQIIRDLDGHPKKGGLFGDHLLIAPPLARAKEAALARARADLLRAIPVELSKREQRIVNSLG